MITVRGPGRCTECSFHVATQGHRKGCSGTARIYEDRPKLGFVAALVAHAADDPEFYARCGAQVKRRADRMRAERNGTPAPSRSPAIAQPGTNPAYVAAGIRRELDDLAAAVEGNRNDTLNVVAFAVFGFVKGGHADAQATRAELERIATAIGLDHSEIQTTLRSAWNGAIPRDVPARDVRSQERRPR